MTTHVAFLRAVNLGKRRVQMSDLVKLAVGLGHRNVWTHINSGNVVFETTGTSAGLEYEFEAALEGALGFEVTTFVRTSAELRRTLAQKPFPVATGDTHFVTFLKDRPSRPDAKALEALGNDFDTLVVHGLDVHWRMRGKSTDTTLTARKWDDIVGHHRSTSRNTTMLRRLMDKIEAKGPA